MKLNTVINTPETRGTGVVYKASNDLDKNNEVTFGFVMGQCVLADVQRINEVLAPKFIEYIEQNPNKTIGILIDTENNPHSLNMMNCLIAGVANINHDNIEITTIIGV